MLSRFLLDFYFSPLLHYFWGHIWWQLIDKKVNFQVFSSFFCLLCPLPELYDFLDSFMERAGISNPYPINVWQKWISSTFFSTFSCSLSAPIYLNLVLGARLSKKWGEERWSPFLWLHCTRTKVIASKLINTFENVSFWAIFWKIWRFPVLAGFSGFPTVSTYLLVNKILITR